ncbi:hypothetical protein D3C72_1392750 [compost metagenome]
MGVHLDAVLDVQAGLGGQLRIGDNADAEYHQVSRQGAAICGLHAAHLAVVVENAGKALAEIEVHAPLLMRLAKQLGHFPRHRTRHGALAQLQHMHLRTLGGGYRGKLEADKACADHHHVARLPGQRRQGVGIGLGLDAEYLSQLRARHWQRAVVRAGRQYQVVIAQGGAGSQHHAAVEPVDGGGRVVQQLDALGGVELGRAE